MSAILKVVLLCWRRNSMPSLFQATGRATRGFFQKSSILTFGVMKRSELCKLYSKSLAIFLLNVFEKAGGA